MDAQSAAEAVVPILDAALASFPIPATANGRLLLKIGDQVGLLISAAEGKASAQVWRPAAPGQVPPAPNTTVKFDSLETFRRILVDETAAPGLMMRRKVKLEGDISMFDALRGRSGSQGDMSQIKLLCAELDAAIGAALQAPLDTTSLATGPSPWVPNEASSSCMKCHRPFHTFRRRHHCRGCGRLMCSTCAPQRADPLQNMSFTESLQRPNLRRLCTDCLGNSPYAQRRSSFGEQGARRSLPPMTQSLVSDLNNVSFNGSVVGSYPSPAVAAAVAGPVAAAGRLEELRQEVENLRKASDEQKQARVRREVEQIWVQTQSALAAVGLVLFLFAGTWPLIIFVTIASGLALLPIDSHISRIVRVAWAATVIAIKVKLTRRKIKRRRFDDRARELEWLALHEVLGHFVYLQIVDLKGFWTKLGQQMSVNVILPDAYRKEFAKLQDKMPAMPLSDVLETLKREFGDASKHIRVDPNLPALGTASIAQVHKATLQRPGESPRDIVVKVQHKGIEPMIKQDLLMAYIIAWMLKLVDPEGIPDVRPLLAALRKVTLNELDFRLEAKNQIRAGEAVRKGNVQVLVPTVIPELVAHRALAMEYVNGKTLHATAAELSQGDKESLVAGLVDHFGVQFTTDGHFHADPHPGNLMVENCTKRLVVLDWGMCVTLPNGTARSYAQLFHAAATADVWLLVKAYHGIGLTFKEGDQFEPLTFLAILRFVLRDSQPVAVATDELENVIKAGEDLGKKGPKRYQKSPFEAFTGDLIYFSKSLELLYMVSSQLGVSYPILKTLFSRSYDVLMNRPPAATPATALLRSPHELLPDLPTMPQARGPVENELFGLLREHYKQGNLLGSQLCVFELGSPSSSKFEILADCAVGVREWLDPRPVSGDTLFNLMDISKLPIALTILRMVDLGKLRLTDTLASKWAGFAGADVTVEQVLSHTAGCWQILPNCIKLLAELRDFEKMLGAFASEEPRERPSAEQRYHYFSFGYLCAGICRHFAGCELEEALHEVLNIADKRPSRSAAPPRMLQRLQQSTAREVARPQGAASSAGLEEISNMLVILNDFLTDGEGEEVSLPTQVAKEMWGREHLMDLSTFAGNADGVEEAFLPGVQAYGTARAVADLLLAAEQGNLISKSVLRDAMRSRCPQHQGYPEGNGTEDLSAAFAGILRLDEFKDFGLGLQLVSPSSWGGQDSRPAWGHLSQSGSVALVIPGEKTKVVSLLLNQINGKSGQQVATSVLSTLERLTSAHGAVVAG